MKVYLIKAAACCLAATLSLSAAATAVRAEDRSAGVWITAEAEENSSGTEAPADTADLDQIASPDTTSGGAALPDLSGGAPDLGLTSPGAILMEASTGSILYEHKSHTRLRPASVTKIMTILLAYEAIRDGKASLDSMVTISKNAAGYGGSTILLEEGEQISLENLIKGMCIASGNDAAIATAEYIGGSQEGFVALMNQRAKELGMNDTHFVNPCGLDADGHETSAYDIALMSRALITQFPEVTAFTTIWHEMMPHQWRKGPGETDMANTNKMIQSYEGMTGLKTGFTRLAKYSLSGTATRDGLNLIAVVMGAETKDIRTAEVASLLNYGFSQYGFLHVDTDGQKVQDLALTGAHVASVPALIQGNVEVLLPKGQTLSPEALQREIVLQSDLPLPLRTGDIIGEAIYRADGNEVARLPLVAGADADKASYWHTARQLMHLLAGSDQTPAPADESPAESPAPSV